MNDENDNSQNPWHPKACERDRDIITPGVYLVRVDECRATSEQMALEVDWQLTIIAPVMKRGTLKLHDELPGVENFVQLQRDMAILGVELTEWRDVPNACAQAEGKAVYIEVLPCMYAEYPRVHFQQLATTHRLSPPIRWGETRAEAMARFQRTKHPLEFHRGEEHFPDDPK
ncbi:MAG: hypothetical protein GC168_14840 [Candidatus Hydrogenedens sp.]|nr:hypothetical protein [Candidatus Hydrogenedens sp.]